MWTAGREVPFMLGCGRLLYVREDLMKTTFIRMSKTMPISSQNTRNRRFSHRECRFKFRTDRRKYYTENVGIYYKGGYARGSYILIQTMDSKRFYVEKTKNRCHSSLALSLRFSTLIPKRPQQWGPLVSPKWASVGYT